MCKGGVCNPESSSISMVLESFTTGTANRKGKMSTYDKHSLVINLANIHPHDMITDDGGYHNVEF